MGNHTSLLHTRLDISIQEMKSLYPARGEWVRNTLVCIHFIHVCMYVCGEYAVRDGYSRINSLPTAPPSTIPSLEPSQVTRKPKHTTYADTYKRSYIHTYIHTYIYYTERCPYASTVTSSIDNKANFYQQPHSLHHIWYVLYDTYIHTYITDYLRC